MRPAAFLDRDGVLNRMIADDGLLRSPSGVHELELMPDVPEALSLLAGEGLLLVVVTNQPEVARGTIDRGAVEEIHAQLRASLPIHEIQVCYHDDGDGCECRKPLPGMLLRAAEAHGIDLARSFLVGDRWKDVAAGQAAGCTTFLVHLPYSERGRCHPDHEAADLFQAAKTIVTLLRTRESDR